MTDRFNPGPCPKCGGTEFHVNWVQISERESIPGTVECLNFDCEWGPNAVSSGLAGEVQESKLPADNVYMLHTPRGWGKSHAPPSKDEIRARLEADPEHQRFNKLIDESNELITLAARKNETMFERVARWLRRLRRA